MAQLPWDFASTVDEKYAVRGAHLTDFRIVDLVNGPIHATSTHLREVLRCSLAPVGPGRVNEVVRGS
jgi:hypothetical protein